MPNNTSMRGRRAPKGVLPRLIRTLFQFYPVLLPVTLGNIVGGCAVGLVYWFCYLRNTGEKTPGGAAARP